MFVWVRVNHGSNLQRFAVGLGRTYYDLVNVCAASKPNILKLGFPVPNSRTSSSCSQPPRLAGLVNTVGPEFCWPRVGGESIDAPAPKTSVGITARSVNPELPGPWVYSTLVQLL